MPTRRRTREQDRAYRIEAERRHNRQARQTPGYSDEEPPPF